MLGIYIENVPSRLFVDCTAFLHSVLNDLKYFVLISKVNDKI